MAITREQRVDLIQILENGMIQVRTASVLLEDGKEIARTFHRHVLDPAVDVEKLSQESERTRNVAQVVWTADVIAARVDKLSKNRSSE